MYIIKHLPEDFVVDEIPSYELDDSQTTFSVYLLKKRNMTTLSVVSSIASFFQISQKCIGYAGLKDKCAVTTQYISIPSSKIRYKDYEFDGFSLTPKGYLIERIYPGRLKGNSFTIIVRNILQKPCSIERMINYFGEQRFSSHNVEIGRYILKKQFSKAAEVIAQKNESFTYDTQNPYISIQQLPASRLKIYLHAYQSWIWNNCVREYIAKNPSLTKDIEFPLPGFCVEHDSDKEALIDEALKKDGLSRRDLILRSLPGHGLEGGLRAIFAPVNNLRISSLVDDVYHQGKKSCTLSFELPKGSYATELIKQLFKDATRKE